MPISSQLLIKNILQKDENQPEDSGLTNQSQWDLKLGVKQRGKQMIALKALRQLANVKLKRERNSFGLCSLCRRQWTYK